MRIWYGARRLQLAAALSASLLIGPPGHAEAQDLSGFSIMLQLGDSSAPQAIAIAPNGRWFLTATSNAIYLSDLQTGFILRRLIVSRQGRLTRVVISTDGSTVYAKHVLNDGAEVILGWDSETGLPIAHAGTMAPPPDAPDWNLIEYEWPASSVAPYDGSAPKRYLVDRKLDALLDVNRVERVEPTNRPNVVQVTVAGEDDVTDESFSIYRFYFIDVVRKTIVASVSGKTLNTYCGQPHGAFAYDGRNLVLAPTELDASRFDINSVVVDTQANPPDVSWSRPCQDFKFAGIAMRRGMIVVSPSPDKVTIWNPANARMIMRLDDIHGSDVLTWSRDLTTFATGFHQYWTAADGHKFGVSVVRSGRKLFVPTDREILELRLPPDGSAVFARTEAGWAAWDTASGASLPSNAPPPSEEDFQVSNTRTVTSPDGKFRIVDHRQLVDVASGKVLVTASQPLHLSKGSRFVWTESDVQLQSIIVWDAASGRQLWTATANDSNGKDFLILEFPDGRVRLSKGAERHVRAVRGFQTRPFDDAAKRKFLQP